VKLEPVRSRRSIAFGDEDARVRHRKGVPKGEALARATAAQVERIADQQRVLYADGGHALLIVLQGRDASGKDGTIRKVFGAVNPQGCRVTPFGPPTALEARHDFLWRVHQAVPPRGMIGIFNRSHYEDVLVPRVHGEIGRKDTGRRLEQINDFERMLAAQDVTILKFLLNVSREEQARRFDERRTDPTKRWKFRAGDLDDRARWDDFQAVYEEILAETSTKHAPWFIVPADDKPLRSLLVARTVADALEALDLEYPTATADGKETGNE
jgi:PPK2 family polyphosphate:nucleotide phosphotransferase